VLLTENIYKKTVGNNRRPVHETFKASLLESPLILVKLAAILLYKTVWEDINFSKFSYGRSLVMLANSIYNKIISCSIKLKHY